MSKVSTEEKKVIKDILDKIPELLNESNITFTQQGKYEFVTCDCDRSQLESLLTSIPSFNKYCVIYTENETNYIRTLYY